MVFDDSLPTQDVVIAPGRSIVLYGRRRVAGEVVTLPTDEAEALAVAGFIVRPETSMAQFITLSEQLEALLGVSNLDDALSLIAASFLVGVQGSSVPPVLPAPVYTAADPSVSGSGALPGATIAVFDGLAPLGQTSADQTGAWKLMLSSTLAAGMHSVTARQTPVPLQSPLSAATSFDVIATSDLDLTSDSPRLSAIL